MHAFFCPTPITIITGGADARAWETRCDKIETSIIDWYAENGIKLRRVPSSELIEEQAQHGGAE